MFLLLISGGCREAFSRLVETFGLKPRSELVAAGSDLVAYVDMEYGDVCYLALTWRRYWRGVADGAAESGEDAVELYDVERALEEFDVGEALTYLERALAAVGEAAVAAVVTPAPSLREPHLVNYRVTDCLLDHPAERCVPAIWLRCGCDRCDVAAFLPATVLGAAARAAGATLLEMELPHPREALAALCRAAERRWGGVLMRLDRFKKS